MASKRSIVFNFVGESLSVYIYLITISESI